MSDIKAKDYIYKDILDIVLLNYEDIKLLDGLELTLENASDLYNYSEEYFGEDVEDIIQEVTYDYRHNGIGCNLLPKHYSRHYEVDFVVSEIEGKWVGWHYWYGGGKHGEPEQIDWIGDAEFVDIESQKEVVVVERVFKRE